MASRIGSLTRLKLTLAILYVMTIHGIVYPLPLVTGATLQEVALATSGVDWIYREDLKIYMENVILAAIYYT